MEKRKLPNKSSLRQVPWQLHKAERIEAMKMKKRLYTTMAILVIGLAACSQKPAELHYGEDECSYCRMMITDNRFAAQLVTETGKAVKFDAIECMAAYAGEHKSELESARYWLSDFSTPGNWIGLQEATLIRSEEINSPMGASLLALPDEETAGRHLADYPGERVSWEQIVK